MSKRQIAKPMEWHDQLIDFLILNPTYKKYEVADHFNVSTVWLSIVMQSDSFKEKYKLRKDEIRSAATASIVEKLTTVAETGIEKLQERLESEQLLSLSDIKDVTDMALRRLGYTSGSDGVGVNGDNPSRTLVQVNIGAEVLESAREKMKQLNSQAIEVKETTSPVLEIRAGGQNNG